MASKRSIEIFICIINISEKSLASQGVYEVHAGFKGVDIKYILTKEEDGFFSIGEIEPAFVGTACRSFRTDCKRWKSVVFEICRDVNRKAFWIYADRHLADKRAAKRIGIGKSGICPKKFSY